MTTEQNLILSDRLDSLQQQLACESHDNEALGTIAEEFSMLSMDAAKTSQDVVRRGAELLWLVSDLAANWDSIEQTNDSRDELISFLGDGVTVLDEAIKTGDGDKDLNALIDMAKLAWPEYLADFADSQFDEPSFDALSFDSPSIDDWDASDQTDDDVQAPDSQQIAMMLSALSAGAATPTSEVEADETEATPQAPTADQPTPTTSQPIETDFIAQPIQGADDAAAVQLADDPEMLEAYLDDALRCVASMEKAAMAIEENGQDREPVRQFCRELHTLKGASATVGLSELAAYLHELETSLESLFGNELEKADADRLFVAVDQVRTMIGELTPTASNEQAEVSAEDGPMVAKPATDRTPRDFSIFASNDDASIRIRASQLDRLMDMLAELVVLRNRQESDVHDFNELNEELTRCATRVNVADDAAQLQQTMLENNELVDLEMLQGSQPSAVMNELSKDIAAVSRGLRDLQKPIIQNNVSISRFIRGFRQEIMQLRRVPMMGLFSRLQRAARDAAKTEGKKIRVQLSGQNAGLEQEIQERLFESLLHVVRNSVSHGIEDKNDRVKAGKDPIGTITLDASSNAQLLSIDVRDDGAGIDYPAVRKRATEKGLLLPGQDVSEDQLGKLIFHPGFSTKQTASSVSGRGVGMDIVATTIEQLKGRIEVDSVAGKGTHIRILIPLKSGIEHVMVFRSGEQLFALPMQAVSSAKRANGNNAVSVSTVFGLETLNHAVTGDVLHIRRANIAGNTNAGSNNLALHVDELIGPEEVVVRKLPNLLLHHPLFSGITLAGSGKKVLLLNAEQFAAHCEQSVDPEKVSSILTDSNRPNAEQKRALVVDDSLTARRALSKLMQAKGYQVIEAGDGVKAIEILRKQTFDLVLTDLDMPKMGGLELLFDIQGGSYCNAAKVVVSSRNEQTFREQAAEAGADEYITKPITEQSVKQLLDRLALSDNSNESKNDE